MSGTKTATAIALAMGVAGAMVFATPASAQQGQSQIPSKCALQGIDSEDSFFSAFDENSDDTVQLGEYLQCLETAGASASQDVQRTLEQQFSQLDPNSDQKIERGELDSDKLQQASQQLQQQASGQQGQGTQVEVQQEPAQVTVQEKQPKIVVQEEPADITVEQRQPEVTVDQPDAQVKVIQPDPEVTIEQPEPQVQVTEAQPKVKVQDAQPNVSVEGADQAEREQTRQLNQQQASQETQGSQQQTASAESGDLEGIRAQANELIGKDVINQDGDQVGELTNLVISPEDGSVYAVLSVGGFLGIGDKEIAMPLDRLQLQGENVTLMSQKDEEQLENMPDYDEGEWQPLDQM